MWIYILAIVIVLFTWFYLRVSYKMTYWKRLGVAEDPGYFPFGSKTQWHALRQKVAFIRVADQIYNDHPNAKIVGSYVTFGQPLLIVRDLDLAKRILVKDFDHFVDRQPANLFTSEKTKNNKYARGMLTNLCGEEWKHMRASLSPVFTSGKLKKMIPLIHKIANECNEHIGTLCGKDINGKELMRDFALDVIVSTGFGIESNTFKDPNNIFKQHSKALIGEKIDFKFFLIIILFLTYPKLIKILDIPFFDSKSTNFFADLIICSMKQRKETGTRRNDLIDLVIDVIEREVKASETEDEVKDEQYDRDALLNDFQKIKHNWTNEELEAALISNSLLTFIVAFDQVSTASSLMLLNLANNPEYQEKLYQEVKNALKESGDDYLTYATAMKLPYLDMVFQETLRMYPATHLDRIATKDYKIPDTDVVIPKGMVVRIASTAVMKDEKYFPNPEKFNPDNFTAEAKAGRHPYAYAGFGHGPRNCIAMRFATMQVKVAVSSILLNFKILPCEKTVKVLDADPKSRSNLPKGGIWFTTEKRTE